MKITGARQVRHIYPRAYCVAKPAPGCSVFVTPWMDAEPAIRTPVFSSSETVRENVTEVRVGDWCALAYVQTAVSGMMYAFPLPEDKKARGR